MLEDMEMGYISTIIVKDSSRFGRNYLEVGQYTDYYFPEHNIRFIAINDCIDSENGEDNFSAFRNVMNEMYAKDISRKVRSSHRLRGNAGEPLSQPPYGYMKSPDNKKKWIIDEEAAKVVRQIFQWCIEGKGNETIARLLQESEVLIPMAYWQSKGLDEVARKRNRTRINGVRPRLPRFSHSRSIAETLSILKPTQSPSATRNDLITPRKIGRCLRTCTSRSLTVRPLKWCKSL